MATRLKNLNDRRALSRSVRAANDAQRQRSLRAMLELIDEAKRARVLDGRPLEVITDELWGHDFAQTDIERA